MAGLAVIVAALVAGPFFQGLFFPRQQHWAEAAVALGFLLWLAAQLRRRGAAGLSAGWRGDMTGWALAGLLGLYALHQAWAIYPHGNLVVLLQYAAALLMYVAIRTEVGYRPGLAPLLSLALVLTAVAVSGVGLIYYAGLLPQSEGMLKAIALVSRDARLMSTFEYHNTLAAFLLMALGALLGLGVAHGPAARPADQAGGGGSAPGADGAPAGPRTAALRSWLRALLPVAAYGVAAGLGYVLTLCFLLTLSRGGIIAFPVLAVPAVVLAPAERRAGALFLLLAAVASAAAVFPGFTHAMDTHHYRIGFYWLVAGGLAAGTAGLAAAGLLRLRPRLRWGLVAATVALAAALAMWVAGAAGGPGALLTGRAARLLDINLNAPNARIRLYGYMRDALKIIADHPWLGGGGQAWERQYYAYQDFGYFASEVHNHYLQVGVDLGSSGILLAVLAVAGVAAAPFRRSGAGSSTAGAAVAGGQVAGLLALFAHSAIDFDLSYLSVLLWAGALGGATVGRTLPGAGAAMAGCAGKTAPRSRLSLALALVLGTTALTLGGVALPLAQAEMYLRTGERAARTHATGEALAAYARAARLAPLHPRPHQARAALLLDDQEAATAYRAAIALDPRDPYLHAGLAERLMHLQRWAEAVPASDRALELQPYSAAHYERAIAAHAEAAIAFYVGGQTAAGGHHRDQALAVQQQLAELQQRSEALKHLWPNSQPRPGVSYRLRLGQALAMAGQYERALPELQAAQKDTALQIQADIWTYMTLETLGRADEAAALRKRPWVRALRVNPINRVLPAARGS